MVDESICKELSPLRKHKHNKLAKKQQEALQGTFIEGEENIDDDGTDICRD